MWKKIRNVHGGDDNVLRTKVKRLRCKYDKMKMKDGQNIVQYVN